MQHYLTHVKITSDGTTKEFKYAGRISTTISKLKPSSPFPSWFWSKVQKDKKATYSSPAGDVTIELEEQRLDESK